MLRVSTPDVAIVSWKNIRKRMDVCDVWKEIDSMRLNVNWYLGNIVNGQYVHNQNFEK